MSRHRILNEFGACFCCFADAARIPENYTTLNVLFEWTFVCGCGIINV